MSVGTSTVGSTGRRSVSAPVYPVARTVAGRTFSRIIVASSASRSAGIRSVNRPGYDLGSNASPSSAMPMNMSRRRATSSGVNEAVGRRSRRRARGPRARRDAAGTATARPSSRTTTPRGTAAPGRGRRRSPQGRRRTAARQFSSMSDDLPKPGASHAMTVWSRERSGSTHCHARLSHGAPCTMTSAGPVPARACRRSVPRQRRRGPCPKVCRSRGCCPARRTRTRDGGAVNALQAAPKCRLSWSRVGEI